MPPEFWAFLAITAIVFGSIVTVIVRATTDIIRDLINRRRR